MTEWSKLSRAARSVAAQRVNIGVTLLALVFLIMVAAAGVRARRVTAVTPHGETLAVLGVTPGASGSPADAAPTHP